MIGGDRELRQQHTGLADRHEQADEHGRRAERAEQPGQDELGAAQLVGDLGQQVGAK
jgi:hypothetical protein